MKKFFVIAALAATVLVSMASCGSLRTPAGDNNGKIWYNTFFGISLDSAVNGDGIIVNQ